MAELKHIRRQAIPAALAKAEKYRLLNDPQNAESICRDVLHVDPENQPAQVMLLLSLTDQFGRNLRVSVNHAQAVLPGIRDPYQRTYYEGVMCERWARALLAEGTPGSVVHDWLARAMALYEKAEKLSPADSADAALRWNACARFMKRNEHIRPKPEDQAPMTGDK